MDTYKLNEATSIIHLIIYVDDILRFTNANRKSLYTIGEILEAFIAYIGIGK